MKIITAEFLKSAMTLQDCPRDIRPEIAFAGRSNAGKSTLLNVLLNRKGLAKTSKKPGKTQMLNYFDINAKYYFVDLPGYGYANVPLALKETWGRAITSYLGQRKTLKLVAHLMDIRHMPSDNDHELLDLLAEAEVPTLLVATKVDKVGAKQREEALAAIREKLGLDEEALIVPFSAITKEGLRDLWNIIDDCLRS
ncbi:MAG TPA: ribosome biogenesis GTP-binding protein YihA/YsxC [Candidatus Hydrogenedentes bacterium]|nr:ribosome biogenesis GTP-binding protein YihA/YsxC [Candidatus Hydrogenedentota bacterium]HOS03784.1 ribosome biogenesis GTP-binding protein YihA/YsxC [Candidatus Hydrogenedentota bacterium]